MKLWQSHKCLGHYCYSFQLDQISTTHFSNLRVIASSSPLNSSHVCSNLTICGKDKIKMEESRAYNNITLENLLQNYISYNFLQNYNVKDYHDT